MATSNPWCPLLLYHSNLCLSPHLASLPGIFASPSSLWSSYAFLTRTPINGFQAHPLTLIRSTKPCFLIKSYSEDLSGHKFWRNIIQSSTPTINKTQQVPEKHIIVMEAHGLRSNSDSSKSEDQKPGRWWDSECVNPEITSSGTTWGLLPKHTHLKFLFPHL